ncbi:MAG: methyl-accepting chemotaxis protein [Pseudomonadota bacterium]
MRAAIEDMRRGNLERRIAQSAAFPEKFDTLRFSFNDLADKLTLVFGQIGRSAQNVHESSENVTQTSDSLSQRTSDQLTSLEQASVSIREMLEIVEETEALVNTVKESSSNNAASAQAGSGVIDEARSAMTKIKEASDKIRSIVDVIDDISFQTNLLALNAGVEAARAGEAGRGFAVVASEVGALAQRSAESASSIRALILDSTKIVEEGSDLMEASADSLRAIRENAATVDEGIEKIRSAATSQSSSLRDIGESISEIERASAGNADTANLVNQNCGELRKEADRLGDPFDLFARASASWGGEELKPARDRPVAA